MFSWSSSLTWVHYHCTIAPTAHITWGQGRICRILRNVFKVNVSRGHLFDIVIIVHHVTCGDDEQLSTPSPSTEYDLVPSNPYAFVVRNINEKRIIISFTRISFIRCISRSDRSSLHGVVNFIIIIRHKCLREVNFSYTWWINIIMRKILKQYIFL